MKYGDREMKDLPNMHSFNAVYAEKTQISNQN
jgi:hypothetical protein